MENQLLLERNVSLSQFQLKSFLIHFFIQPGPQFLMNFMNCTYCIESVVL